VPALRVMSPVVTWVNRNALSMTPMTTKAMRLSYGATGAKIAHLA
jgi:hypothetical protein